MSPQANIQAATAIGGSWRPVSTLSHQITITFVVVTYFLIRWGQVTDAFFNVDQQNLKVVFTYCPYVQNDLLTQDELANIIVLLIPHR